MDTLYGLTLAEYEELLYLDQSSPSGLRWKKMVCSTALKDSIAGSYSLKCKHPCWRLKVKKKACVLARVLWFLYYRVPPEGVIDHMNGDTKDHSIPNLRDIPQKHNCENRVVKNETGTPGVYLVLDKYGNESFKCQGRNSNGERWVKNFAIGKYGYESALRLAKQYRMNKEQENNVHSRRVTLMEVI